MPEAEVASNTPRRRTARSTSAASGNGRVRIFVSYDVEHDRELYLRLLEQSKGSGSGFDVIGCSERTTTADTWSESVRRRIRDADQVIVICGEHTKTALCVSAELRVAEFEKTPHILLWGRRETMCTKPAEAGPNEGMYSWTRQVLHDQMAWTRRKFAAKADVDTALAAAKRA